MDTFADLADQLAALRSDMDARWKKNHNDEMDDLEPKVDQLIEAGMKLYRQHHRAGNASFEQECVSWSKLLKFLRAEKNVEFWDSHAVMSGNVSVPMEIWRTEECRRAFQYLAMLVPSTDVSADTNTVKRSQVKPLPQGWSEIAIEAAIKIWSSYLQSKGSDYSVNPKTIKRAAQAGKVAAYRFGERDSPRFIQTSGGRLATRNEANEYLPDGAHWLGTRQHRTTSSKALVVSSD